MVGVCEGCGCGTFGRLCGACKGEPAAVRRRHAEQNAMTEAFKKGAIWALHNGKREFPYHQKWDTRSEWFKGFDQAAGQLETLRKQYK